MKRILFTGDTLSQIARDEYKTKGFDIIPASYDLTEDAVAKLLVDCDGYILGGDEIASKSLLEKAGTRLKAISFFGAGYEKYVDAAFAKSRGIQVTNTPGANSGSVAEFTVALLFAAAKNIVKFSNETKTAKWDRPKTHDISGKTIGIIGMGNIGARVAKMLHFGFGCKIVYSGNSAKKDLDVQLASKFVDVDELLKVSDIILVHASLTDATRGLINKKNISLIKDGAVLINTARAEIVDESALVIALQSGKLRRAAFDVFYEEPINDSAIIDKHELLRLEDEKFIITPHVAYYTFDAIQKMEQMALDNIIQMISGNECPCVVNK
jgi:lactate dehydrogenase-like 2-hydroxyacid dehydrogenase